MKQPGPRALLLLLAAALAASPCPAAQLTDEPDVNQFYAEGLRLYGRGELDQATGLLQAALARFPQPVQAGPRGEGDRGVSWPP